MDLREGLKRADALVEEMHDQGDDDVRELAGLIDEVLDVFREDLPSDEED